jgi:hypothetical protein
VLPGRVALILRDGNHAIAVLERFQCSSGRDSTFGMPILTRPNDETVLMIVPVTVRAQVPPTHF